MKRLIWTPRFVKSAEKFLESNPELTDLLKERIRQIEENPFNATLRTHKLKGKLSGFFASSINYSYRLVFQFDGDNDEIIIFHNIGTHDEVF